MKTRFIISVLLGLLTVAFVFKDTIKSPARNSADKNLPGITMLQFSENEKQIRREYLLSAKTCKYECESTAGCFRYYETGKDIADYSEYGSGAVVRYCKAGDDRDGYVVRGLLRNTDQSKVSSEKWLNGSEHNWIIRPRMRIDKNEINREDAYKDLFKKVCRLEILNSEGAVIKEIDMDLRYFLDKCPEDECRIYNNGEYRDNHPLFVIDSVISINGIELNSHKTAGIDNSKLDYRLYWYGNCDLWIDYILVENETADDLFKGKYNIWLQSMTDLPEVTLWRIQPQKFDSNSLLCIKYIKTKMSEYSNNKFAMIY